MAKAKRKNILFWIIFIIIVAAGLWYYYKAPAAEPAKEPAVPAIEGPKPGDLVAINYVLMMTNGSVVDTNDEALAKEFGITTFSKGGFRFIVGQSGKVKGFDEALGTAELGKNLTKIIQPSEPVIQYIVNRTKSISRNQAIPRFQSFSLSGFNRYFRKKPILNDVVMNETFPWPYKVINVTSEGVICDPIVKEGKTYHLPSLDWNSSLLVVTYNDLMFRHNPTEGQVISTELGPAVVVLGVGRLNISYTAKLGDVVQHPVPLGGAAILIPMTFKVTESGDNAFAITRINYLPQETLVLRAELVEWQKDVKEVKAPLKVSTNPVPA